MNCKYLYTVLIGKEGKLHQRAAFPEVAGVEDPLDGIDIKAVERFVGIGTDTDAGPEGFTVGELIKLLRQIDWFYKKLRMVADGNQLVFLRQKETAADVKFLQEDLSENLGIRV